MQPWDKNGWSKIALVELDKELHEAVFPIFERKRFSGVAPTTAAAQRNKSKL